jgi:hypothetical protein
MSPTDELMSERRNLVTHSDSSRSSVASNSNQQPTATTPQSRNNADISSLRALAKQQEQGESSMGAKTAICDVAKKVA